MTDKIKRIFLTGLFTGICTLSVQATDMLSVLREIEVNNVELKAIREEGMASVYEAGAGNSLDATSVEYSPFFMRGADGIASSELIVTQEFDFPTLYAARSKSLRALRQSGEEEYASARNAMLMQAASLYLELVMVEQNHLLLERRREIADSLTIIWEGSVAKGGATLLDLNRVKMDAMEIHTALMENDAEAVRLRGELRQLNGNVALELTAPRYPDLSLPLNSDEFIRSHLASHPDVRAGEAALTVTKREESVARQGWLPKLTLGYRRNTELEEASNGFVVGASFPLFSTGGKVKAAVAKKRAADMRLESVRQKIESQLISRYEEACAVLKALQTFDPQLMSQTLELLAKSLQERQLSITDYYSEVQSIKEKEQTYITLQNRYYQLLLQLYGDTL